MYGTMDGSAKSYGRISAKCLELVANKILWLVNSSSGNIIL